MGPSVLTICHHIGESNIVLCTCFNSMLSTMKINCSKIYKVCFWCSWCLSCQEDNKTRTSRWRECNWKLVGELPEQSSIVWKNCSLGPKMSPVWMLSHLPLGVACKACWGSWQSLLWHHPDSLLGTNPVECQSGSGKSRSHMSPSLFDEWMSSFIRGLKNFKSLDQPTLRSWSPKPLLLQIPFLSSWCMNKENLSVFILVHECSLCLLS